MSHLYAYIALSLASDRTRELREAQRAHDLRASRPKRPSAVRQGLAHALAALSRGSAGAARRLDTGVADDLGRSLAPRH